jgi:hypothetical protein
VSEQETVHHLRKQRQEHLVHVLVRQVFGQRCRPIRIEQLKAWMPVLVRLAKGIHQHMEQLT